MKVKVLDLDMVETAPHNVRTRLLAQMAIFMKMGYTRNELAILISDSTACTNRIFKQNEQIVPKSFTE